MTQIWKISTTPASWAITDELSDRFERSLVLTPDAIALVETDTKHGLWRIEAYFQFEPSKADLESILQGACFDVEKIKNIDWVQQSQSVLTPITAERFFVHGAHDRQYRPCSGISVQIEAGLAFGTGHHGTTYGCLLALASVLKRKHPRRILDVGCGSGVLAIAAAKATGQIVFASDIDPVAISVARQNARINEKGPQLRTLVAVGVEHIQISTNGPYDLMFANILAGPLMRMSTSLTKQLASGGDLVLSGLLHHQEARIISAYRLAGLTLQQRWQQDGWSTLLFSRRV